MIEGKVNLNSLVEYNPPREETRLEYGIIRSITPTGEVNIQIFHSMDYGTSVCVNYEFRKVEVKDLRYVFPGGI